MARGTYAVKSKIVDDDATVHLNFEWSMWSRVSERLIALTHAFSCNRFQDRKGLVKCPTTRNDNANKAHQCLVRDDKDRSTFEYDPALKQ
jgi:hypothetical protein